jgi:hypothetical protein
MKWINRIGLLLCAFGLTGILWSFWPVPRQSVTIPLYLDQVQQGNLQLSTPAYLQTGVENALSLRVEFFPEQNTDQGSTQIEINSRIEINRVEYSPKGIGHVVINANSPATLIWKTKTANPGKYKGTVWLFATGKDGESQLLLARSIAFQAQGFLGMTYRTARILSILTVFTGICFMLVFFSLNKKKKCISRVKGK